MNTGLLILLLALESVLGPLPFVKAGIPVGFWFFVIVVPTRTPDCAIYKRKNKYQYKLSIVWNRLFCP